MRDKPCFQETYRNVYTESMQDMSLRILLGKLSADWMAIIAEITRLNHGLQVIGVLESPLDILLRTEELRPDMVVLSQLRDGGEPGICTHFLLEYPNVELLLLPASPGSHALWRMVLRKENCGEASHRVLQRLIQEAIESGGSPEGP